jgi:hypothetical protein
MGVGGGAFPGSNAPTTVDASTIRFFSSRVDSFSLANCEDFYAVLARKNCHALSGQFFGVKVKFFGRAG